MDGEIWAKLRKGMPLFLDVDYTPGAGLRVLRGDSDSVPDAYLRVWDEQTGAYVQFYRSLGMVEVTVPAPADPAARERVIAIIESAEGARWMPRPAATRSSSAAGSTGWPGGVAPRIRERLPVVDAVIEIMRDGLDMDEDRLRVRTWGEDLPEPDPAGPRSLRPTSAGAPACCTDWPDFTARLDWVLHTLPESGVLALNHPNASDSGGFVQFMRDGSKLSNEASSQDVTGIGQDELRRRLSAIGWREDRDTWGDDEFPCWIYLSDARIDDRPNLDGLARAVAAVFRDVHGLSSPQELTLRAFRQGYGDELAYLDAELGIARAAE